MAADVVMPQMGESIFEGTITKWLKKPGDKVERDEPLFEISTDKVDAEIPSPSAGVLKEIKVNEGQTVPIQTVVGVIDAAGAAGTAPAPNPAPAPPKAAAPAPKPPAPPPPTPAPRPPAPPPAPAGPARPRAPPPPPAPPGRPPLPPQLPRRLPLQHHRKMAAASTARHSYAAWPKNTGSTSLRCKAQGPAAASANRISN